MLSRAVALAGLASTASAAGTVGITIADCCQPSDGCTATGMKYSAPSSNANPGTFNFTGAGTLTADLSAPTLHHPHHVCVWGGTLEVVVELGGVKVADKKMSACGKQEIDLPLNLAKINIDSISCPAKSGTAATVTGTVASAVALPSNRVAGGKMVLCIEIDVTPQAAAQCTAQHCLTKCLSGRNPTC
eukprot:gene48739-49735_t